MEEFKGKVVLITGSSAGIGAGIAVYLAARGARLSLTGRDQGKLRGVAQRCVEAGVTEQDVLTTAGDLTDETFRNQLVTRTVNTFGQLDVLVNNAGLGNGGNLSDPGQMESFNDLMNLNVNAHVSISKLAIPHLLGSRGNIVNISSNLGLRPCPGLGAYCMSKAALDMFTKVLALELASKGVRVNSVNPGCVRSEIHRVMNFTDEQYEAFLARQAEMHPIGRVGEPKDVARAVAFLASDKSSFITGELLVVDGGSLYGGNEIKI
ncbi:3-oxoacyl-[acyl-carrier-protein] reductase FabG-like isoform X2 [Littorina saxatilis]|uniref:Uncharacterized protein n=1 Tax=Littorina saxatilis TaxID=31220 RepID=A0AAN9C5F7_9CAEN